MIHLLVSCPACERQFDAGEQLPGDHFHCRCGRILDVPEAVPHDAAVVRCSSCGAARQDEEPACAFCRADFTLHEKDLHTVCPKCLARISDKARYCHHCATPILPAGTAGEPSQSPCPACGGDRSLVSRSLGEPGVSVLECPRCAGLWLRREAFQVFREKAQDRAANDPSEVGHRARGTPAAAGGGDGPTYRACPTCEKLMHRLNYGRKSGVIIDVCRPHGMWFDAAELDTILRWIQAGGENQAQRLQHEELTERARTERIRRDMEPQEPEWNDDRGFGALTWGIGGFLASLFDE